MMFFELFVYGGGLFESDFVDAGKFRFLTFFLGG